MLPDQPYVLWILGSLFVFLAGLCAVLIKIGLLMFQWRREIDGSISENSVKIAVLSGCKNDVDRHNKELADLRERVSRIAERRFGIRDRDEDDIL